MEQEVLQIELSCLNLEEINKIFKGDLATASKVLSRISKQQELLGKISLGILYENLSKQLKETLNDRLGLSNSYYRLGRFSRMLDECDNEEFYHTQAYQIRLELLGPNNSLVAQSLEKLGMLESSKNNHQGALTYLKQAVRTYKSVEEKFKVAHTYICLSNLYSSQLNSDKAEHYARKALSIYQEYKSPRSPCFAKAFMCLSHVEYIRSNFEKSISYCLDSINILNRKYPMHPLTADAYFELYEYHVNVTQDYIQAKDLAEKIALILHNAFGHLPESFVCFLVN